METSIEKSAIDRISEQIRWQKEYQQQICQRLTASTQYIRDHSPEQVKTHLRSFLTLLEESHRYPALTALILELITCLHPLPLRMGYGGRWEPEMRFAFKRTREHSTRLVFLNHLAENALIRGKYSTAIQDARTAMQISGRDSSNKGLACKILFDTYRISGKNRQAKRLITRFASQFQPVKISDSTTQTAAVGWLNYSQCRLKLLREQGKVNEALDLAIAMILLDFSNGNPQPELTAALLIERSTLLWVKTRFTEAVSDLEQAIALYQSIDDHYHASSMQSNLGLVYWSMGDFKSAELSLRTVIDFFTRTGSDQLVTSDIGNLGLVFFSQGKIKQAEEQITLHVNHARRIGVLSEEMRGLSNLADTHFYMGKYQQALEEHQVTDPYLRKHGARDGYMLAHLWVACCMNQLGEKTKAIQRTRQVLRWCEQKDVPSLEGPANRCLAHLLPKNERDPYLQHACQLARTQNRRLEEAACLLQLAEIASTPQDQQALWQAGADILNQIGASAWLEGHSPSDPPFLPMMR